MEVTKDEQRKLDDLFRKIADRDEFVARQRRAAETLRRKYAEPPVTVWAVVDFFTAREWGEKSAEVLGIYLNRAEAVEHIRNRYDYIKDDVCVEFTDGDSICQLSHYDDDGKHVVFVQSTPFLSTFKTEGQR